MADKGIDCHSFDMPSFGKSELDPEKRGKIDHFDHLVNVLLSFADQVKKGMPLPSVTVAQLACSCFPSCLMLIDFDHITTSNVLKWETIGALR
jgi:hypothetical protein